ncbi:LysM peptidoglycan-binding domain-containing protein [Actinomadura parmotrematis]|uniref:LysM peptidoglycan-binding domain-containing protein n=1 Tax=Actinomadura parmotrematis TaxID=2864039 RepID=A0ABS7G5I4_9ACTN|nr:LysM peptidoglycan-binding domain-containing protein [Actinomadura parmotrematis]MBW8487630.1 LysM peptidoglycan-binding domain-containing protein [Actinomadura parmotrematis]
MAYSAAGRCGPARRAGAGGVRAGGARPGEGPRRLRLVEDCTGVPEAAPEPAEAPAPAPRERRPSAPPQGLRLTRRGRVVLVTFVAAVLLAALWATAGRGARAGSGARPASDRAPGGPRVVSVVVGPGDTLWDIALRTDPHADPRRTVRRISDLNGLSGSIVQPGQRLRVPAR